MPNASQVAIQRMLSDVQGAIQRMLSDVQGSSVLQREQRKYDVKKKHQKLQSCLAKYLGLDMKPLVRDIFKILPDT